MKHVVEIVLPVPFGVLSDAQIDAGELPAEVPGQHLLVPLSEQTLLDATQYPTNGAYVELSGHGTAKLRSDGAVTGKVADDARLDNLLGTGPCLATTSGNAQIVCAD
jgi:hypothetical protein